MNFLVTLLRYGSITIYFFTFSLVYFLKIIAESPFYILYWCANMPIMTPLFTILLDFEYSTSDRYSVNWNVFPNICVVFLYKYIYLIIVTKSWVYLPKCDSTIFLSSSNLLTWWKTCYVYFWRYLSWIDSLEGISLFLYGIFWWILSWTDRLGKHGKV